MEIVEKINFLLQEKNISKKEFAKKLSALSPKLYATGEIPSEQTIYRYLNGSREIKIELVPYITEVLGVSEQELFSSEIEYSSEYNYRQSKEVREVLELLRYLPKPAFEKLKERLLEYKKAYDKGFE